MANSFPLTKKPAPRAVPSASVLGLWRWKCFPFSQKRRPATSGITITRTVPSAASESLVKFAEVSMCCPLVGFQGTVFFLLFVAGGLNKWKAGFQRRILSQGFTGQMGQSQSPPFPSEWQVSRLVGSLGACPTTSVIRLGISSYGPMGVLWG